MYGCHLNLHCLYLSSHSLHLHPLPCNPVQLRKNPTHNIFPKSSLVTVCRSCVLYVRKQSAKLHANLPVARSATTAATQIQPQSVVLHHENYTQCHPTYDLPTSQNISFSSLKKTINLLDRDDSFETQRLTQSTHCFSFSLVSCF